MAMPICTSISITITYPFTYANTLIL